jgi:hypothetical protein
MSQPLPPLPASPADQPWTTEPNRVAFEHAGFPCIIKRGPIRAWCGYVGVPPGHPWHGKNDSSIYGDYTEDYDRIEPAWPVPSVHGGVTYGEACDGDPLGGVCHVAKDGEPDDVWWIGFDCAHAFDYVPGASARVNYRDERDVYRDQAYVTRETQSLAEQARAAAESRPQ